MPMRAQRHHTTIPPLEPPWPLAWQRAVRLTHACDRATHHLPDAERPSLGAQLRHAARAVPAHLATGHGCARQAERAFHLAVARGSLVELETRLRQAQRLGHLPPEHIDRLWTYCGEVRVLLGRLAMLLGGDGKT